MDVAEARRRGVNYWTIPGHCGKAEITRETIEQAICRIFGIREGDLKSNSHKLGKHFYRFVLERLKADGTIAEENENRQGRKYKLSEIRKRTMCLNINNSVKVVYALMKTDRHFKADCDLVLQKIKLNLIEF